MIKSFPGRKHASKANIKKRSTIRHVLNPTKHKDRCQPMLLCGFYFYDFIWRWNLPSSYLALLKWRLHFDFKGICACVLQDLMRLTTSKLFHFWIDKSLQFFILFNEQLHVFLSKCWWKEKDLPSSLQGSKTCWSCHYKSAYNIPKLVAKLVVSRLQCNYILLVLIGNITASKL